MNDLFQVSADGDTCWVHFEDGSTIGRFSKKFGMDAHRSASDQMKGMGQCLSCTHGPAGPLEWEKFRNALYKEYGVVVPIDLLKFDPETP